MDFPPTNPNFIGTAFIFGRHFSITADKVNDTFCGIVLVHVMSKADLNWIS